MKLLSIEASCPPVPLKKQVKQVCIINALPRKRSFVVQSLLHSDEIYVAKSIPRTIVHNPLNSRNGIQVSLDNVYGHECWNMLRPAVLRQYFALCARKNGSELFCYGSGSGMHSAGVSTTREMTPEMKQVAEWIHSTLLLICATNPSLTSGMDVEPFNHCTVLFYFQKQQKQHPKQLGYHCDNLYSNDGNFQANCNSQKENTPTCTLTLEGDRELCFLLLKLENDHYDGCRRSWQPTKVDTVTLSENMLFILHPADEIPHTEQNSSAFFKWKHGVPRFMSEESVSVALVFRTVTRVGRVHLNQDRLVPPDAMNVWKKLKSLLKN